MPVRATSTFPTLEGQAILRRGPIPPESSWSNLIPMISIIAAGCILSSSFTTGAVVGCVDWCTQVTVHITLKSLFNKKNHSIEEKEEQEYKTLEAIKYFVFTPIQSPIVVPICEEFFFRGCLQTGLSFLSRAIFPMMTVQCCLFPPIVLANLVAITTTSVIFGLCHLINGSATQAIFATVGGFEYGMLMNFYGMFAPIGAHIVNNSLSWMSLNHTYSTLRHKQITKV